MLQLGFLLMSRVQTGVTLVCGILLLTASMLSLADSGVVLDSALDQRRKAIAGLLSLSADESRGFWRVYEAYLVEKNLEFDQLAEASYELLAQRENLSESVIEAYTESFLKSGAREATIDQAYQARFRAVLGALKTAKLYWFEHQLRSNMIAELANDMLALR